MAENLTIQEQWQSKWRLKDVLFLVMLALLAFWPLSMGVFAAKNDNIAAFLPTRFHIVEALRHWDLPLWTPYMYMGYPLHGDMQSGAWNPVVWLLALFGRYNLTSLHAEVIIALIIAACGMYRLLLSLGLRSIICLTGASLYLLCGFITDSVGSNLPFLWGAAYVPFCLAYGIHLFRNPSWNWAAKLAFVMALSISSAYPSFFILTAYILCIGFISVLVPHFLNKNKRLIRQLFLITGLAMVIFLLMSAPMLLSYYHLLPHYARGTGVQPELANANSLHPYALVSLALPALPFRMPLISGTDIISRNVYFGLAALLLIPLAFPKPNRKVLWITAAGFIFFLFFSLGHHTPVRKLCYDILPLMDTFRHPSNARLFVIIAGLILGMTGWSRINQKDSFIRYGSSSAWVTATIFLILAVFAFLKSSFPLLKEWNNRGAIKEFLYGMDHHALLLINSVIQCMTLIWIGLLIRRQLFYSKWMACAFIANAFTLAQVSMPFTIASKLSPGVYNQILSKSPAGFPDQNFQPVFQASQQMLEGFDTIGIGGFYKKQIALTDIYFTPTILSKIERLNRDTSVKQLVLANPFAYIANQTYTSGNYLQGSILLKNPTIYNSSQADLNLAQLRSNIFEFSIQATDTAYLCLQQTFIPGWICEIDGRKTEIMEANQAFMAVTIPPGKHKVEFRYLPVFIVPSLMISFAVFLFLLILFIKRKRRIHA